MQSPYNQISKIYDYKIHLYLCTVIISLELQLWSCMLWSVCHNLQAGREVTCSYRSTCYYLQGNLFVRIGFYKKVRNYICSLASSFTDSQILIKIDQTEFCLKYDVEDMKVESAFAFSSIFRKPMNWTCQLMPGWHFPYSPTQQEKNLRNIRNCKL